MDRELDWTVVEAEIDRISRSAAEPFDPSTVANIHELVRFAREHCPVPEIAKGYWSTIRFSWKTPPLEVEVFGDRFEIYRFYDGHTEIREVKHTPGNPLPQELAVDLPSGNSN